MNDDGLDDGRRSDATKKFLSSTVGDGHADKIKFVCRWHYMSRYAAQSHMTNDDSLSDGRRSDTTKNVCQVQWMTEMLTKLSSFAGGIISWTVS